MPPEAKTDTRADTTRILKILSSIHQQLVKGHHLFRLIFRKN